MPNAPLGKLVCTLQADASRVTVSSTDDVTLDWGKSGCADGRTQYLATGDAWQRLTVPDDEQTVSSRVFDPVTRRLTVTRYMLGAQAMQALRSLSANTVGQRFNRHVGTGEFLRVEKFRHILAQVDLQRGVANLGPDDRAHVAIVR